MKAFSTPILCLLAASASQAATTISLDLPVDGNYATPTEILTAATDPSGATFDIVYTISAISNDTGPVVGVIDQLIGVGSANDINPNHFNSLEGDGSGGANGSTAGGEGLSFGSLGISNFQANGSEFTEADVEIQFQNLDFSAVGNRQDGVNISFIGYGDTTANMNLSPVASPFSLDLTTLANFSPSATDLFLQPDNLNSGNRWNISGLSATFTIPEPSSSLLLGGSALMALIRRRRV